ncbi:MAG: hypothetical protein Q8M96_21320, partial [Rubrivivax sp.]|nr:hypothetical protein [Rubrivivax sp.]
MPVAATGQQPRRSGILLPGLQPASRPRQCAGCRSTSSMNGTPSMQLLHTMLRVGNLQRSID